MKFNSPGLNHVRTRRWPSVPPVSHHLSLIPISSLCGKSLRKPPTKKFPQPPRNHRSNPLYILPNSHSLSHLLILHRPHRASPPHHTSIPSHHPGYTSKSPLLPLKSIFCKHPLHFSPRFLSTTTAGPYYYYYYFPTTASAKAD